MPWGLLGKGAYNKAYINSEKTLVFKVRLKPDPNFLDDYEYDEPSRSVRLWNQLNPDLDSPALVINDSGLGNGWACPFITGRQSNDDEIFNASIDIFNRLGRIVVDGTGDKNFLTTSDGKTICVDIGMALQMEREEEAYHCKPLQIQRRKSVLSLKAWGNLQGGYDPYFENRSGPYPKTVQLTKALLFIKAERPDITNVDFLRGNSELCRKISLGYDASRFRSRSLVESVSLTKCYDDALSDIHSNAKTIDSTISPVSSADDDTNSMNSSVSSVDDETLDPITSPVIDMGVVYPEVEDVLCELEQQAPLTLEQIKESCIENLNKYLKSRVAESKIENEKFDSSDLNLSSKCFRNTKEIVYKISEVQKLKTNINVAITFKDIETLINNALGDEKLTSPGKNIILGSSLNTALGRCGVIYINAIDKGKSNVALNKHNR